MKVEAIKTRIVHAGEISLTDLLSESITEVSENSVVVISSKIVSLCENRIVDIDSISKDDLVECESDWYVNRSFSPLNYMFAISKGNMSASAGIDLSNSDGHYTLWPKDSMISAEHARQFLTEKFARKNIGVLIIDSVTLPPLRRGTVGQMIGWSGFKPLKDYRGQPDLFGRKFEMETLSIVNGLAAAANLVMGEGDEGCPLAIVSDVPFIEFTPCPPTNDEIKIGFVSREEDIYAPFFNLAPWKKGGGGYEKPGEK